MVGELVRVQRFPALEGNGFAAFLCLRCFAFAIAYEISIDIRAESVALDFHDEMLAIGAAQYEVGCVVMPASIFAQILGKQISLAKYGMVSVGVGMMMFRKNERNLAETL